MVAASSALALGALACLGGSLACTELRPDDVGAPLLLQLESSSDSWINASAAHDGCLGTSAAAALSDVDEELFIGYQLLEGPHFIDAARLSHEHSGLEWTAEYREPGSSEWLAIGGFVGSGCQGWNLHTFDPVLADAVRLLFTAHQDAGTFTLQEVNVFGYSAEYSAAIGEQGSVSKHRRLQGGAPPSQIYQARLDQCQPWWSCNDNGNYIDMNGDSSIAWRQVNGGWNGGLARIFFSMAAPEGRRRVMNVFVNGQYAGTVVVNSPRPNLVEVPEGGYLVYLRPGNNLVEVRDDADGEEPDVAYLRVQPEAPVEPDPTPDPNAVYIVGSMIQAEDVDYSQGVDIAADSIGYFDAGDFVCYEGVDLGGVDSLEFTLTKGNEGGQLQARSGGPDGEAGLTFAPQGTGGWGNAQVQTVPFNSPGYGLTTLCMVGTEGNGILSLDSVRLGGDESGLPEPAVAPEPEPEPQPERQPPAANPQGDQSKPEIKIGMHPGKTWNDIQGYEDALGVKLDYKLFYQSIKDLNANTANWIKAVIDGGHEVEFNIEFFDNFPNLDAIANGRYDAILHDFIDGLMANGNPFLWIRPLHEFNGDWYNWGIYVSNSQDGETFKRAYRHIVELFRSRGTQTAFQLNYNVANPRAPS